MTPTPDAAGPATIAANLLSTLQEEATLLDQLRGCFDEQMDALRGQAPDRLETATQDANEIVNRMNQLRQVRLRQMRLMGRVLRLDSAPVTLAALAEALQATPDGRTVSQQLLDTRTTLRSLARTTQQQCEDLEFTLQYALQLGREMLETIKGLDTPPPTKVYTARGDARQTTTPRSLLNRVG